MIHQGKIVVCCQGLIGGREKRIIGLLEGPGSWTLDLDSRFNGALATTNKTLLSGPQSIPQENARGFLPCHPVSHKTPHRMRLQPRRTMTSSRRCFTTAVLVRSHRQATYSRPTWLIRGWRSLKLNLFIVDINSRILFLSSPLCRSWQISSFFHPTLPETLHESINQRFWPQFDFAGGCC